MGLTNAIQLSELLLLIIQISLIIIGLSYTYREIKNIGKDEQARFWLELQRQFSEYKHIYAAFRPTGEWVKKHDFSSSEWAEIEFYLGLFEHCEMLLNAKLIREDFFVRSYKVQLQNVVNNHEVCAKLNREKNESKDLLSLFKRIGIDFENIVL